MSDTPDQKKPDNRAFKLATHHTKGFIEGILFKLIGDGKGPGFERNAKIAHKADRKKKIQAK